MDIQEYIGNGAVLQRLHHHMTEDDLAEFNTLADLHPELQQELVYAYDLLTEISARYPPDQVHPRFTEAYNGHLQLYRETHGITATTDVEDLSHKYAYYANIYKVVFIFYLVFLALTIALTIYFYYQVESK
ncbi:hypothetical protein [Filimonas effusa]|uniref:Uncharacterized protein n=1 Tax=Filimonas effusa TaxID=2508721 RepID=A0A4Q1D295_9BACT|nr:hypothetical protein [Filimonas effusa]RXK81440.1 hypothetical protein ESB13_21150 [Filimonas effusa]